MMSVSRLKHIRRLTDDTGILEHALGVIPRRKEGYSTDDQARALWLCLEWLDWVRDDDGAAMETLYELIDTYLSFLLWVQKENGHFHNNIAYDRTREKEEPSDDCLGRCLWAAALAMVKLREQDRRAVAEQIYNKALFRAERMRYPRGQAYALASVSLLTLRRDAHEMNLIEPVMTALTVKLKEWYRTNRKRDWHWFEPVMSYSNGIIPWGLLCAYEATQDREALHIALESLNFLIDLTLNEKGEFRPIGNRGWCVPGQREIWDQQPIDVMKMALAVTKAYELTGEPHYWEIAGKCRNWFYGANDGEALMVNPLEGSCYDGLGENGVNLNQGAESAIAYQLTEILYSKIAHRKKEGVLDDEDTVFAKEDVSGAGANVFPQGCRTRST